MYTIRNCLSSFLERIVFSKMKQLEYRFIGEQREYYWVKRMDEVLRESRSGYYAWARRDNYQEKRASLLSLREFGYEFPEE